MDRLVSGNGRHALIVQDDGNLVLYQDGAPVWATMTVVEPEPPPDPPEPQTLPRLVPSGQQFRLATGAPWTAVECSEFNLLNRWQHGESVDAILAQRRDAGFNLLRVWTLYDLADQGIGTFLDIDYARIPAFLARCADYGLYVEFTAYTSLERKSHWSQLTAACQDSSNVLCELVNEGTLPVNAIDMSAYGRSLAVLCSHGSGGSEVDPPWEPWDYVTRHTNGASEEQRKVGKQAYDLAQTVGVPVLTNETSRYPDVGMWVGADPLRAEALACDSAAGAALLCAGSCFHSVAGKASTVWDAATLAVATTWANGARSVPLLCQPEPYRHRTDLETPGILRVYQRGPSASCLVYIRE